MLYKGHRALSLDCTYLLFHLRDPELAFTSDCRSGTARRGGDSFWPTLSRKAACQALEFFQFACSLRKDPGSMPLRLRTFQTRRVRAALVRDKRLSQGNRVFRIVFAISPRGDKHNAVYTASSWCGIVVVFHLTKGFHREPRIASPTSFHSVLADTVTAQQRTHRVFTATSRWVSGLYKQPNIVPKQADTTIPLPPSATALNHTIASTLFHHNTRTL